MPLQKPTVLRDIDLVHGGGGLYTHVQMDIKYGSVMESLIKHSNN